MYNVSEQYNIYIHLHTPTLHTLLYHFLVKDQFEHPHSGLYDSKYTYIYILY